MAADSDDDWIGNVIDLASHRPLKQQAWFSRLQRIDEHQFRPTLTNAILILSHDQVLRGALVFDAFRSEHLITRAPPRHDDDTPELSGPYPRAWGDEDVALVQAYLQRVWSYRFARATVEDAMLAVGATNHFHPVRTWLDGLRWDGQPRLDTWLTQAFGCPDDAYHRSVAAKFLIAAVRRVRRPGTKFDHMLILEGEQDIGKSTSLATLFGQDWFSDSMPLDLGNRDAALSLLGVWCVECAEIDHLIRNEDETTKAFLSRPFDWFRPPYGRNFIRHPRQTVFAGTTNKDDYLRDETGNRRYWPVRCVAASVRWIALNRDDLWAEAAYREGQGEPVFLADEEVREEAARAQLQRLTADMWGDAVREWLEGGEFGSPRREVRIPQILTEALGIPRERQSKSFEMRAARILKQLGWQKSQKMRAGELAKRWYAPGIDPESFA
jgi:putative DNA primase/helicase